MKNNTSDKQLLDLSQETELQNATKSKVFTPSANQEKWLDVALQFEHRDISNIATACRIHRTNWYKWCKDLQFVEWFTTEWDRRLKAYAWQLDAVGLTRALRGEFKFWESMQKRVGNLQEAKNLNQVNINPTPILGDLSTNTIEFVNYTQPEELKQFETDSNTIEESSSVTQDDAFVQPQIQRNEAYSTVQNVTNPQNESVEKVDSTKEEEDPQTIIDRKKLEAQQVLPIQQDQIVSYTPPAADISNKNWELE